MIFLGDIAHPFSQKADWGDLFPIWKEKPVVANLEGALASDVIAGLHLKKRVVFNHVSILQTFREYNVRALCLSNNHITDLPSGIDNTLKLLDKEGIARYGAGRNIDEACTPAYINEGRKHFILVGCGWNVIRCRYSGFKCPGVNSMKSKAILSQIASLRQNNPNHIIILTPHWNYEMELYPQPAHRILAMKAIDSGANAVIGHHSHCVGGIEFYKESPIVYSLGNWWFPQGVFFNGNLSFKDETLLQLALEWNGASELICHWFHYDRATHRLVYDFSEDGRKSERIKKLAPFKGMPDSEYHNWFRGNRVKNLALPIYKSCDNTLENKVKDVYVACRHIGVLFLKKIIKACKFMR